MIVKVVIILTLILNNCNVLRSYLYTVEPRDEFVVTPCDRPDFYFVDHFIDMSDLKLKFLENGSLYAHGSAVWKRDMPTEIAEKDESAVQLFRKKRGEWVNTIYNLKRPDFCSDIFNPYDLWFPYVRTTAKENQKCPLFKGQRISFDNMGQMEFNTPDPNLEGDYVAYITVNFKSLNETLCVKIYGFVYRI